MHFEGLLCKTSHKIGPLVEARDRTKPVHPQMHKRTLFGLVNYRPINNHSEKHSK